MDNVTADQRIATARELVDGLMPRHDVLLPAPVLTSMYYELRRAAIGLLEVIDIMTAGVPDPAGGRDPDRETALARDGSGLPPAAEPK